MESKAFNQLRISEMEEWTRMLRKKLESVRFLRIYILQPPKEEIMPVAGTENLIMPIFNGEGLFDKREEQQKQALMGSFDLLQDVDKFQVGTLKHHPEDKFHGKQTPTFVPIFPFMYDDLKQGNILNSVNLFVPKPPQV